MAILNGWMINMNADDLGQQAFSVRNERWLRGAKRAQNQLAN